MEKRIQVFENKYPRRLVQILYRDFVQSMITTLMGYQKLLSATVKGVTGLVWSCDPA